MSENINTRLICTTALFMFLTSVFGQNQFVVSSFLGFNKKGSIGLGYEYSTNTNKHCGASIGISEFSKSISNYDSTKSSGLKTGLGYGKGNHIVEIPDLTIQLYLTKTNPKGFFYGASIFGTFTNSLDRSFERQFYFILNTNNSYIGTENSNNLNNKNRSLNVGIGIPIGTRFNLTDKMILSLQTTPGLIFQRNWINISSVSTIDTRLKAEYKDNIITNYFIFGMANYFNLSLHFEF